MDVIRLHHSENIDLGDVWRNMDMYWYALRCKPRKEDVVWRQVQNQGLSVFYPRIRVVPVNK